MSVVKGWIAGISRLWAGRVRLWETFGHFCREKRAYFLGGTLAVAAVGAVAIGFAWKGFHGRGIAEAGVRTTGPLPALKDPRILVEKSAGRLTVFDADRPVKAYKVISGFGYGDKVQEGDQRTPEGDFYVCMKNPQSKYVLSLGLSYPNIEDANRGLRAGMIGQTQYDAVVDAILKKQMPPWNTPLGGEIMIHGCAYDRTGTLGCVAMQDGDIRELYAAIPVGTPVEIRP